MELERSKEMIEIVMEVDDEFWNIINQLTVFKEQKEITHCKDCKYWEEESSGRTYCERTIFWTNMDADDFCSRGERAE